MAGLDPIYDGDRIVFERARILYIFVFLVVIGVFVSAVSSIWSAWRAGQFPSTMHILAAVSCVPFIGNLGIRVFRPSGDIVIDPHGFHDRLSLFGKIPWSDIVDVSLVGTRRKTLILNLRNHEQYINRHSWRRWFLFNDASPESRQIILNLAGLLQDPNHLVGAVRQEIESRRPSGD
jgi:hypothetical protein